MKRSLKQLVSAILMLIICFICEATSVVFIHLGSHIPLYLCDATNQARLFNDETVRIIVVAEQCAIDGINDPRFDQDHVEFVACETLIKSEAHTLFAQKSSLDRNSREGFWFKATERFFYLDELMRQYDLHDVIHMEYDNMIYVDVHELLPVLRYYKNIGATFDAEERCIAGLIYISNPESLHPLVSFLADMASRGVFEMQAIALFKRMRSADDIDHLPIVMPEYVDQYGLRSTIGQTTSSPQNYMRHIEEFSSIFDAAAWGQFLGGIDPRNGPSVPGFVNETCLFDPSKIECKWELDAKGRKIPYVYMGDKRYRINNLHIHSKNLKAFASC
jgi:hypothetical protein